MKGQADHRPFGVAVFLASLSTLLGASMVGYLVIRLRAETWPPEGTEGAPRGLWISTVLLLLVSFSLHHASRRIRRGDPRGLRRGLLAAGVLALGFLVSQGLVAATLISAQAEQARGLFAFTFFMLTGLHAVHVLGGLVPLCMVIARAYRSTYSQGSHTGISLIVAYWHFLLVVWLVMFALLMV